MNKKQRYIVNLSTCGETDFAVIGITDEGATVEGRYFESREQALSQFPDAG